MSAPTLKTTRSTSLRRMKKQLVAQKAQVEALERDDSTEVGFEDDVEIDSQRAKRKQNLQKFEKMIYISSLPKSDNLRDLKLNLGDMQAEVDDEPVGSARPLTDRSARRDEDSDSVVRIAKKEVQHLRPRKRGRSRSIVNTSSDNIPLSQDIQLQIENQLRSAPEHAARVGKHKSDRSSVATKATIEDLLTTEQEEDQPYRRRRLTFGHNDGSFVQAVLNERTARKSSTMTHNPDRPLAESVPAPSPQDSPGKPRMKLSGLRSSLKRSLGGSKRLAGSKSSLADLDVGPELWGAWMVHAGGPAMDYQNVDCLDDNFKPKVVMEDSFGWQLEKPWNDVSLDDFHPQIEYNQFESLYYLNNFFQKDHTNFIAQDKTLGDVVASVRKDKIQGLCSLIIRTKKGVHKMEVRLQNLKKSNSKSIFKELALNEGRPPNLTLTGIRQVDHPDLQDMLVKFEKANMFKRFKFGVLLVKEGQTKDDEYFSNVDGSERWTEFLGAIGKKITLADHKDYTGGLDVSGAGSTGLHSVYTSYYSNQNNYEVMYHVSTYLPFQEDDIQHVERKRHLGNDVINIIFNDSDEPFNPLSVITNFIHVYCVVQVDKEATEANGETTYRVEISKQDGVPPFGPPIPAPGLFLKSQLRDWMVPKLINGERASLTAPAIRFNLNSTRKTLLRNIVGTFN